ncbi:MAG: hypothetical protein IJT88_01055 [Kiritimatiellae bacterium]|nr:hypothetical protein [Kiritimatiellia bacterium]
MRRLGFECEHNGKCEGLPYCGGLYFEPEKTDEDEEEEDCEDGGEET